jgi:uncharacterized membrane protein YoaK (UPF0700 family)
MSSVPSISIALRNGLLLLLACVAGAVDAISYLGLGRVFTANMTGNTVLLGLALVQADVQEALRASLALIGFLGGAALGTWVVEQGPPAGMWPRTVTVALAIEWGLLCAFAIGWPLVGGASATLAARGPLIVLSALAMGVQSAAARRLDVSGIATTYITGTLTSLAARLMGWRYGAGVADPRDPRRVLRGVGLLAAVWGVYIAGAVVAGACMRLSQELAVGFPLLIMLVVIVIAAVHWP